MEKSERKQVVYLDLEELKYKERFEKYVSYQPDDEIETLEEQYENWLDLIDR